jgi:molybdopterin-guanine dinucleotide biosynthesis protein A
MGTDKASLVLGGETLAARAARRLTAVCETAVEVGSGVTGLSCVTEQPSGSGPLAALAAGGEALRDLGRDGPALLLAADLPNVGVPLLELLRDWRGAPTAVPEVEGRLQPVCARYGPDEMVAASSLVLGGVRALHALLDIVSFDVIPEAKWRAVGPPDAFVDVDTPEAAARLGIEFTRLP